MITKKEIMNNLQFLRMKKWMSQRQLADLIGLHSTILNRIERGWLAKINPDMEARLQEVFGSQWTFERLMEPVNYEPDA